MSLRPIHLKNPLLHRGAAFRSACRWRAPPRPPGASSTKVCHRSTGARETWGRERKRHVGRPSKRTKEPDPRWFRTFKVSKLANDSRMRPVLTPERVTMETSKRGHVEIFEARDIGRRFRTRAQSRSGLSGSFSIAESKSNTRLVYQSSQNLNISALNSATGLSNMFLSLQALHDEALPACHPPS